VPLEIRTAIERRARRDARQGAVLHEVWQQFLDRGGPLPIDDIERAFRDRAAGDVRASLMALDEADLLLIADDVIQLAYPFTTGPNAFAVEITGGVTRYTCCAVDALGIAPMLDQAVTIRSRCHHCDEPLVIETEPDGPRALLDAMVWIAPRDPCAARVASGL
jgi:hypothetical protein